MCTSNHLSHVLMLTLSVILACSKCKKSPNFVVIFADDVGYGDFQSYGHPTQEKTAVDKLAAEGLKFSQWYAAASLCSPSRAALLTGRYPIRSGSVGPLRVFRPTSEGGLAKSETTISEALKELGYRTGIVGKWHLGVNEHERNDGRHLPHHHGFDFVGHIIPMSLVWACNPKKFSVRDMSNWCVLARGEKIVQQPIKLETLSERLRDDVATFIEENHQHPFFLYFALPQTHSKLFCMEQFCNSSKRGLYGDSINEMSWLVDETIAALKKFDLEENTLVFFISDHGPEVELCIEGGSTAGLRGSKASTWEGGFRVPSVAWWPGTIEPGTINNDVFSTMDIYPTLLELAGGQPSTSLDGISLVSLLRPQGNVTKTPVHDVIFYYCSDYLMAVRIGSYKVHYFTQIKSEIDVCVNGIPQYEDYYYLNCSAGVTHDPPLIFDLDRDPFEKYPLDPSLYPDLLSNAALKVAEHKQSILSVPSQLEKLNPRLAPCCNPPSCTCGYTVTSNKDEL